MKGLKEGCVYVQETMPRLALLDGKNYRADTRQSGWGKQTLRQLGDHSVKSMEKSSKYLKIMEGPQRAAREDAGA